MTRSRLAWLRFALRREVGVGRARPAARPVSVPPLWMWARVCYAPVTGLASGAAGLPSAGDRLPLTLRVGAPSGRGP